MRGMKSLNFTGIKKSRGDPAKKSTMREQMLFAVPVTLQTTLIRARD